MWLIESYHDILNKLHSWIVKGISKTCPKHDPTNFEFKSHRPLPLGNRQYFPLLHQSGMSALSVNKSYDTAGVWQVDRTVYLTH